MAHGEYSECFGIHASAHLPFRYSAIPVALRQVSGFPALRLLRRLRDLEPLGLEVIPRFHQPGRSSVLLRCPFVHSRVHYPQFIAESVSATRFASLYFGRGILPLPLAMSPFQMGYGGPKEGHTWTWIRHCSVSPGTQDLQAARLYPSSSLPALTPCYCPLQVSHPGKVPVLEVSLSTSPVFLTGIQGRCLRGAQTRLSCLSLFACSLLLVKCQAYAPVDNPPLSQMWSITLFLVLHGNVFE